MNPNQQFLSRRRFFRGLTLGAGGVLLEPFLRNAQVLAGELKPPAPAAKTPLRFVFFIEGNGFNPAQAQPETIPRLKDAHNGNKRGDLLDVALAGHKLPSALEPLEPFKDRLTILQGLSGRVCGGGHSNNFGALGVYSSKAGAAGETIDAAIAKARPGIFPLIGLGITDRKEHTIIYNTSAWTAGKQLPTQCRPDLAYNTLFGSVADGPAKAQKLAERDLLDFMSDDVRRVETRLSGDEKEKLSAYLQALEAMRSREDRVEAIAPTLAKHAPAVSDKFKSEGETDRLEAHVELAAAALICGLTNVVTLSSGAGDPFFSIRFKGLGIELDKHSIGHGGGLNGRTSEELTIAIRKYHLGLMARLAERLKAVPEGEGTMLDNTVIVYLSDAAESHHSRCGEWPMLILGDGGGRLKTRGRLLYYPAHGKPGHHTIGSFYTTLLHAAGAPRDSFGLSDPTLKDFDLRGPMKELLA
jgi:hypothetical protein